jgi:hypothetical protein
VYSHSNPYCPHAGKRDHCVAAKTPEESTTKNTPKNSSQRTLNSSLRFCHIVRMAGIGVGMGTTGGAGVGSGSIDSDGHGSSSLKQAWAICSTCDRTIRSRIFRRSGSSGSIRNSNHIDFVKGWDIISGWGLPTILPDLWTFLAIDRDSLPSARASERDFWQKFH